MKRLIPAIFSISFLYLASCSEQSNIVMPDIPQVNSSAKKDKDITTRARLDAPPFISQGNEFSAIALMDDGKIIKYQTFKASKAPTTIVYQSKWVVLESHPTTANEANTILKLTSQNGYSKEYKILKDIYDDAGLTR
ncbi:MAG: hypothetical protein U0354_19130 [Candidatus Sericytochromatia bacterium]